MTLPSLPFRVDDKYEAMQLLGKGGGGYALLARKGRAAFVVKLLNIGLSKDPAKVIQKFKKEFLTLKKINHPHIGKIFDYGFDAKIHQHYFAGEYIEGEDIKKASAKLPPEKIENLFVQALQALHYLHTFSRAGLRHNDIKAANILVTKKNGQPDLKLIDFGLATLSPLDVKGGTASYMSPEQIALTFPHLAGKEKFLKPDHRTDLYSLGVAFYLCFTGVNPFFVERDSEATFKRHFGPLPPPPSKLRKGLPKYLDTILLKLLNKNPEDRYNSAAEVIQELKILSGKSYSVIPAIQRQYYLPEGEWIGRPHPWNTLRAKWDQLFLSPEAEPAIVWIVGGRGQGKTKLIDLFKNYVQAQEGKVALLRHETGEAVKEWQEDIDRHTHDFHQPLLVAIDNFSEEHPAFEAVRTLWNKIRHAGRWNADNPIRWLFVFTRTPFESQTTDAESHLESEVLFLKNFDGRDLRELVKQMSPDKTLEPPNNFIEKLKNHTDGNPLFVTQVLKALGDKGLLLGEGGQWHPLLLKNTGIDFSKLPIPKDLKTALNENLASLGKEEKQILMWLSCSASSLAFQELLQVDSKLSIDAMENLKLLQRVVTDDRGRLLFKNPFFKRTVYAHLEKRKCGAAHDTLARFLKKSGRPNPEIAFHLARGSKPALREKANEELALFYTRTGRWQEALETRRAQLESVARKSTPKKLGVVLPILRLLNRLRLWDEAEKLSQTWIKKCGTNKDARSTLLHEKGLAFLGNRQPTKARECLEKAFAIVVGDKTRLKEQLLIENTIARTWLEERKMDKAIALYQKTRTAAKKLKAKERLEVTNNDLGYAFLIRQDSISALQYLEEDLELYEKAGDKTRLLRCHYFLAGVLRRLKKDFDGAIKHYQKSLKLAEDLKDNDWMMRIYNGFAATYLDRAEETGGENAYKQALKYFEESLALCRFLQADSSQLDAETAAIYLNIGMVHRELGNFSRAMDAYKTIITVLEAKNRKQPGDLNRLCETYIATADCFSAGKKFAEMEAPLKKAWALAKDSKDLLELQLATQILWAEFSKATNDTKEFKKHLDLVEKLQTENHIHPTPMAKKKIEALKACHSEPQAKNPVN
ncbi:MAG: protein kinase [Deltaproteobacteria bacterium]|nr:protein kinase [Deltaproteobacteria bacterium]